MVDHPLLYRDPLDTVKSDAMGYVIHIWEEPVPTSLEHADELVGELIRAPKTAVPNPKNVEAAARLTAKYPFEEDPWADPEGEVWSDGPLTPRRGERIWSVGVLSQYLSEVQPFVVSVSNQLGLIVYDMQLGKAYLPDGTVLSSPAPARPWWKFWLWWKL